MVKGRDYGASREISVRPNTSHATLWNSALAIHDDNNTLPKGYLLHWYEIVDVIGRGGFGITYLARDKNLDLLVAIKEYLPEDFASRKDHSTVQPKTGDQSDLYAWGLERFVTEARILAKFNHPNIIRVLSVFEQNQTAYMVMEYAQGDDLATVYKNRRKEHRPLDEQEYLDIFVPICDGLSLVHNEGFIHRDIKPANIYISHDAVPMLLDFGSARKSVANKTKAMTSLVTFGYAPFEQYQEGTGKQGPWTDIYSLGASIYVGITGKKPEDAMARGGQLLETGRDSYKPLSQIAKGDFSDHFLLAIDNALMFKADDRPKHILRWADMLLGRIESPPLPKDLYVQIDTAEFEKTVIMPRVRQAGSNTDRSQGPPTSRTRGSQGFVSSLGKRLKEISHDIEQPVQSGISGFSQLLKNTFVKTRQFISALPTNALFVAVIILVSIIAIVIVINNMPANEEVATTVTPRVEPKPEVQPQVSRVDDLLSKAHAAFSAMHYTQPQGSSAYDYLQSVLAIDANNKTAKQRLIDIQKKLLQQAQSYSSSGNNPLALKALDELLVINPDNVDGLALKHKITGASEKRQQISTYLAQAETSLQQKKYTRPKNASAYYYYQQVLELERSNTIARQGIQKLTKALLASAQSAYKSGHYTQANGYLDELDTTGASYVEAKTLRNQIGSQQQAQTINRLLSQAKAHLNRHRYTSPQNNNAYDTYRQVLKLDKSNRTALAGINSIKNYYKKQFNKHLASNNVKSAGYDLQRMKRIAPNSQLTRSMEKSLLQKKRALASKPEIEQVSELVAEYKAALEKQSLSRLRNISKFKPGREQFLSGLFQQYRKFTVNISGFSFIANKHRASANVELSRMIDKNNQVVMPGSWSKFVINITRDKNGKYYVNW